MSRAAFLPCSVRHLTNAITLEITSPLVPVPGCKLYRVDGVKGKVVETDNASIVVSWDNGKLATYTTVKFAAVI